MPEYFSDEYFLERQRNFAIDHGRPRQRRLDLTRKQFVPEPGPAEKRLLDLVRDLQRECPKFTADQAWTIACKKNPEAYESYRAEANSTFGGPVDEGDS